MKIADLQENYIIEEPMRGVITDLYQDKTKNDSPYIGMKISDTTGSIDLKIWDKTKEQFECSDGDVVEFTGSTVLYNNSLQLKIQNINKVNDDPANYLKSIGEEKKEEYIKDLNKFITLTNKPYSKLLETIFLDEKSNAGKRFLVSPAGKFNHGAILGGLLEHTINVTKTAIALQGNNGSDTNLSLVIAGALLHDIGKIMTYSYVPVIDVTPAGALLDHVVIGLQFVKDVIRILVEDKKILFEKEQELLLLHCIVSHHGKQEWGAPVEPRIKEAILIALADEAVTRMEQFDEEIKTAEPGKGIYSTKMKKFLYNVKG